MSNSHPLSKRDQLGSGGIPLPDLARYAENWLLAGDVDQQSPRTLGSRRDIVKKLLWFLRREEFQTCGVNELRGFFIYVTRGHKDPVGRWGNPKMTAPTSPSTVKTYYGHLRTLFRWLVEEGLIDASPMARIPVPTVRADDVQPYNHQEIAALLAAARQSRHAKRDEALMWFLLDTGVRASELCGLCLRDLDIPARQAQLLGKGRKKRVVSFQKTTARTLRQYLADGQTDTRDLSVPVFVSERGEALTRSGLLQIMRRLGKDARVSGDCSVHRWRHTFAIEFLKAGGNVFSLQTILGHTSLAMTNRYVQYAQADIHEAQRQFSPAEHFRSGGKRSSC